MSYFKKTILQGTNDNGDVHDIPVTAEGHLEIALHHPRNPFGSIHVEELTPVFQTDAVYGLNDGQVAYGSTLSGAATASDSNFVCSTGTTQYAQAFIQSRKRLRYRPGQGLVGRFAGLFTTGVANSYQVIGFGHAEDGVYFGYVGSSFGVLYSRRGVREVRTLTVSAGGGTETVTITLNGVAFNVAITGASNIQRTVWELSQATYSGWKAYPQGATVVFVKDAVGVASGTYSLATAGTAAGTFAQTKAGVAATETFVAQADWNGDKLDGTGSSGVTADWTKGNVFQIGIQYLGYGAITFQVEALPTGENNADFVTVHTLRLPNSLTTTSFGNPSYPFSMAVYSAGSTTTLSIKVGSFAGFIEGHKYLHGNRFTYDNKITTAASTNIQAIFTVYNSRYYGGRTNQSVVNLLSFGYAYKHTQPGTFFVIRNGALGGNPNFTSYATNSTTLFDIAATTVTATTNDLKILSVPLGETSQGTYQFSDEITLQPGEWITIGCKTDSGTATFASATLNTREDQ